MRALALLFALIAAPALAQEAPVTTAPSPVAQPANPAQPAAEPAAEPPAAEPYVPPAIDPLGDLISQTTDEEEVAAPSSRPAPHKPTLLPIPAPESPAPSIAAGEHLVPQGSYMPAEQIYEMRVKGSIVAAQGLQGPLDGGWKVKGPDGSTLYTLQIVDPAGGAGPVEGAWRDVRRPGAVGSTGLIETVDRTGQNLVFRFNPRPDQTSVLTLTPAGSTRWSGSLYEAGATQTVIADREAPPSLPPGYVIQSRGPVIWGAPRAAAPARATPVKAPACSTKGKTGKALKAAKARCAALAKKGGSKGKAVAKGKKGSKAKATPARKGKATAKKAPVRKKPTLR